MHTAQHLVKKALSGDLARGRTIILITHHITLCLPIAAYLVELASGEVIRRGSTQELREKGQLQNLVDAEDVPPAESESQSSSSTSIVQNEADSADAATNIERESKPKGKLIEAEARAEGRVSTRTYWTYIRAAGLSSWFLTVVLMILIRLITIGNQVRHSLAHN